MKHFLKFIIRPYLRQRGYKTFCEIGAKDGAFTDGILPVNPERYVVVDPCFDADLIEKYGKGSNIAILKGISLDALPVIEGKFDCIFIDGDHNWYTVYNELRLVERRNLLNPGGTIFLHDVCWPYGRRDMYYTPEQIPQEYRHPYEKKGIVEGENGLVESGGLHGDVFNAKNEGGPRNGVLTAIEDFLKSSERKYLFFSHKDQCGLGVVMKPRGFMDRLFFLKWLIVCRAVENIKGFLRKCLPGLFHQIKHSLGRG